MWGKPPPTINEGCIKLTFLKKVFDAAVWVQDPVQVVFCGEQQCCNLGSRLHTDCCFTCKASFCEESGSRQQFKTKPNTVLLQNWSKIMIIKPLIYSGLQFYGCNSIFMTLAKNSKLNTVTFSCFIVLVL